MKDQIPEITEIMKKLDKMCDEATSGSFKRDVKEIVASLADLRELMDW